MGQELIEIETRNDCFIVKCAADCRQITSDQARSHEDICKSKLEQQGAKEVIFDVTALEYMSSILVNFVTRVATYAKSQGGGAILCTDNNEVISVLEQTNLNALFDIMDTVEEAIKKASK